MRRAVFLFLLCYLRFCPTTAWAAESAESLFLKANGAFQKGLDSTGQDRVEGIQQAASLYEQIIEEEGIRNGYLYYNLGNCYFQLGHIGKAILNYRRAERLVPNYSDLKRNLKSARGRRKDAIQKSQVRSIARTLLFWHYLMSLQTKIVVFSIVFSTIWILLLVKLFFDRPLVKWALCLCIFFALVFGVSGVLESYKEHSARFGVILAEETVPRKGPGESYARSFKEPLHEGAEFRVRDGQAKWLQIELDNGSLCWVNRRHLGLI